LAASSEKVWQVEVHEQNIDENNYYQTWNLLRDSARILPIGTMGTVNYISYETISFIVK
jgi:hypothetical protein